MKNRGFTYIEVVVSITVFLLAIIPTMEFNSYILESDKKYKAIEKNLKNINFLEKKIISKGYKELNNFIEEYRYEFQEDSYKISNGTIFDEVELPFLAKKGEKIILKIEKLKSIATIENIQMKDILYLKIEYYGKYKKLEKKRLISETDEYYQ